jgi:hypothetical protein
MTSSINKKTLRSFYYDYNLMEFLAYSTVRNYIFNNLKELEEQKLLKRDKKNRIRNTYIVLNPVRLRNKIMNHFHDEELYTVNEGLFFLD